MPNGVDVAREGLEFDLNGHEIVPTPRQIRHVTSIQVRNLTPFPVRDAFASALKQPSEQPQFSTHGHLSDDLDVTLGKKRARRISAASVATLNGLRYDGGAEGSEEPRARNRTLSKASVSSASGAAAPSSPPLARRSSIVGPPTTRPNRPRTISIASSHHSRTGPQSAGFAAEPGTSASTSFPNIWYEATQSSLEEVVHSRLVETFITVTLPHDIPTHSPSSVNGGLHTRNESVDPSSSRSSSPTSATSSRRATVSMQKSDSVTKSSVRRSTVTSSISNPSTPRLSTPLKRSSVSLTSPPNNPSVGRTKSASVSYSNGKLVNPPTSPPPAHKQRSPIPPSLTSPALSSFPKKAASSVPNSPLLPSGSVPSPSGASCTPDYLSHIHRPSTNPRFELDAGYEFARGVDLGGSKMRVEVWGRVEHGVGWSSTRSVTDSDCTHGNGLPSSKESHGDKGKHKEFQSAPQEEQPATRSILKGKGKQRDIDVDTNSEWKVLEGWDVDFHDLIALPAELADHPSHLPSNTLLITLSPPGRTFYAASSLLRLQAPSPLPQSSASGYNSDPELEARKVNRAKRAISAHRSARSVSEKVTAAPRTDDLREKKSLSSLKRQRLSQSASWPDLLKVINRQAVVLDTEQSLYDILSDIYITLMSSDNVVLTREVYEREALVTELRAQTVTVISGSTKLRDQLTARKAALQSRRDLLTSARKINEQELQAQSEQEHALAEERDRLSTLRGEIVPMRSVLITMLGSIFPIELLSPPDLLFTILDVPLPIPLGATDPAPPLSLPAHREVTEDAVATALGYAAHVVQLLAAYLGNNLVYPVTCVGSRSLIKDGISAMVGPRMFPLYSKGVDTYRFEYGVFLLNKDIEMLMSDRNLRALDMRHTLPNLKNLLLTLTDYEITRVPISRFGTDTIGSISSLRSPVLAPTAPAPPHPHPDGLPAIVATAPVAEHESPPASGSTTPDASALARKSRAFLDLTPLTGFLRARYPTSSRQSAKPTPDAPEVVAEDMPDVTPTAESSATGLQRASSAPDDDDGSGDDEDDRRTIRGAPAPDPDDEGKRLANGNGNGRAAAVPEPESGPREEKGGLGRANGAEGAAAAASIIPALFTR